MKKAITYTLAILLVFSMIAPATGLYMGTAKAAAQFASITLDGVIGSYGTAAPLKTPGDGAESFVLVNPVRTGKMFSLSKTLFSNIYSALTDADTTALQALIDAVDAELTAADEQGEPVYTTGSRARLGNLLQLANDMVKKCAPDYSGEDKLTKRDQARVDKMTAALEDVKTALLIAADKSTLESMLNQAGEKHESDYTVGSWEMFELALTVAEEVNVNGNLNKDDSQVVVDNAASMLEKAIAALNTSGADETGENAKTKGWEVFDKIKTSLNDLHEKDYQTVAWANFQTALSNINSIDTTSTREEISAACKELTKAQSILKENKVEDRQPLLNVIEEANLLSSEDYTPESWQQLEEALTAAEVVIKNRDASAKVIADEVEVVRAAIDTKLVPVKADISKLQALVGEVKDITKGDYTEKSWEAFEKALSEAKALCEELEGESSIPYDRQADIDKLTKALEVARGALTKKPEIDLSKLTELITKAEAELDKTSAYTKNSLDVLAAVLANAKKINKDTPSLVQEDVEAMIAELDAAIEGLELKPTTTATPTPEATATPTPTPTPSSDADATATPTPSPSDTAERTPLPTGASSVSEYYPSIGGIETVDGKTQAKDAVGNTLKSDWGWDEKKKEWYFFDENGNMVTNAWVPWKDRKGTQRTYLVNETGAMCLGWQRVNNKLYHMDEYSGHMHTGWVFTKGPGGLPPRWYCFDDKGVMKTGWEEYKGKKYWLSANGDMLTGYVQIDGSWHHFKAGGEHVGEASDTGWKRFAGGWSFSKGDAWTKGWEMINGEWYYFDDAGYMLSSQWKLYKSTWYYLTVDGSMATGSVSIKGETFRFDDNGAWIK